MEKQEPRRGLVGGAILVVIGVIALVGRLVPETYGANFGSLILLGLAGVFLVAGIVTRESGWFVPTGILGGLGAGVALITSRLMSGLTLDGAASFCSASPRAGSPSRSCPSFSPATATCGHSSPARSSGWSGWPSPWAACT